MLEIEFCTVLNNTSNWFDNMTFCWFDNWLLTKAENSITIYSVSPSASLFVTLPISKSTEFPDAPKVGIIAQSGLTLGSVDVATPPAQRPLP